MANEYVCTDCGKPTPRDLLTVRKAVFLEMGLGGRTVRSRVTGWLCPVCTSGDTDFNREPFKPPVIRAKRKSDQIVI